MDFVDKYPKEAKSPMIDKTDLWNPSFNKI
jgi:hypothetical protein